MNIKPIKSYTYLANSATKMKAKFFILSMGVLSLVFSAQVGYTQQQPLFTQYMFNGLVINPAYTGSHESLTLTASFRRQWTGIKGAPQAEVFSAHSPIKFSRSSAGFVATHDQVGVTNQYMAYGTYAYHIPVSRTGKVAVGGQAGVTYYNAKLSELDIVTQNQQNDPAFEGNDTRYMPNLGLGAYFYTKRTYVGLASPTIINNKWKQDDPLIQSTQERHYFLSAGHVFDLNSNLKLKPNVLVRWVESGPFQYDINANLLIHEILWVGASYRMQDSVDGLLEWNINNTFRIGYSYGYPINALSTLQSGTHEVVLNFSLRKNNNILHSPRYF